MPMIEYTHNDDVAEILFAKERELEEMKDEMQTQRMWAQNLSRDIIQQQAKLMELGYSFYSDMINRANAYKEQHGL